MRSAALEKVEEAADIEAYNEALMEVITPTTR